MLKGKEILVFTVWIFSTVCTVSCKDLGMREPPCSLKGLPLDSSEDHPYVLPTVPDNVAAGIIVWQWEYEGDINRTTAASTVDYKYLTARLNRAISSYVIAANGETNKFTRGENRRVITRQINLYCNDTPQTRVIYHLIIPVQDVTPPAFQSDKYIFNITVDWNPDTPISGGQFVIVSDDAFELGTGALELAFEASEEDTLRIVPHKLWDESDHEVYYHRLDIYIDEKLVLTPGEQIQLFITAKDQFNAGIAKININVS